MSKLAAALCGVVKQYPDFTLGPVDLEIPAGSIVGLVGENGAGKTTLLKMLCGVNRPDGGSIALLGGSPQDVSARAELGVVFEDAYFYENLTGRQVGRALAGVFGSRWDAAAVDSYLHRFSLPGDKRMKELSRGMRMKLSLAGALAHHPTLLVLDEATSGLDPVVRGELMDLFLDFIQDENHSILMSSHITADLEQAADSIAYLHRGRLLFHENKDDLMQEYGILRCGEADLHHLAGNCVIHTRRTAFGCESLVKGRAAVTAALPGAVMDPAKIDDLMRFYSGRDAQ